MKYVSYLTASFLIFYSLLSYADPLTTPAASSAVENPLSDMGQLSGNLAFTTNYIWRGISQTNNDPALQGGMIYTFKQGFYVNVWGSNVKFGTANLELDPMVGFAKHFDNGLGYDIGVARYFYPDAGHYNFNEAHITGTYQFLSATIAYSNNVFNSHGSGTYYNLASNYTIPAAYIFNLEEVGVSASIGRYNLTSAAGQSYNDYKLGLSKKFYKKLKLEVAYVGTNGKNNAYPLDKDQVVGTLSLDL